MLTQNTFIDTPAVCEAWLRLLERVYYDGSECAPRGKKIRELLHTQVTIRDARNNILTHPMRDINYRFMVAEWLWIMSGRQDVAWIERFNKNITQFSDNGIYFQGAYGPRFRSQVDRVLNLLRQDPDSRQAVIRIFDDVDLIGTTKDVPCTLSLQLLIREGRLHGIMTMRSNDLWLGFPYDVYNFSQLTNAMAGELGLAVGSFTLQAGSSHLYENNWEAAGQILKNGLSYVHWEKSPQLRRLPAPEICKLLPVPGEAGTDHLGYQALNDEEQGYVRALTCKTKAEALEVLKTL